MTLSDPDKMKALTVAARCSDAYSADCWGPVAWVQAAQMLLDVGFSEKQAEGILRSKLTRWARDAYGEPSTFPCVLYAQVETLRAQGRINEYTGETT